MKKVFLKVIAQSVSAYSQYSPEASVEPMLRERTVILHLNERLKGQALKDHVSWVWLRLRSRVCS